jgi:hypothetical protein
MTTVSSDFWDHLVPGIIFIVVALVLATTTLCYSEGRTFYMIMMILSASGSFGGVTITSIVTSARDKRNPFVENRMHLVMFWAFSICLAAFMVDYFRVRPVNSNSKTNDIIASIWRLGAGAAMFINALVFYGHSTVRSRLRRSLLHSLTLAQGDEVMSMMPMDPLVDKSHYILFILFTAAGIAIIIAHFTKEKLWSLIAYGLLFDIGSWFIVIASLLFTVPRPAYDSMNAYPDVAILLTCTLAVVFLVNMCV